MQSDVVCVCACICLADILLRLVVASGMSIGLSALASVDTEERSLIVETKTSFYLTSKINCFAHTTPSLTIVSLFNACNFDFWIEKKVTRPSKCETCECVCLCLVMLRILVRVNAKRPFVYVDSLLSIDCDNT